MFHRQRSHHDPDSRCTPTPPEGQEGGDAEATSLRNAKLSTKNVGTLTLFHTGTNQYFYWNQKAIDGCPMNRFGFTRLVESLAVHIFWSSSCSASHTQF